jgi:RHS repeat-associated protein
MRRWLYTGSRIVAELGAANEVVSRFMYVERDHVPDAMVKSGITYRLVTDLRGSVVLVVNTATGAVAQHLAYDEFGRVLSDTNPGFQPFGFAGGLYDSDTGLVRFGARDYDAVTGRWSTRDPILFRGGDTNLYRYAAGDPINFVDPTGLDIWIEGPSGGEVPLHQSINVGDPFGDYASISFGLDSNLGSVYDDTETGGPIESYLHTTPAQDAAALKSLLDEAGADSADFYGPNTCRTYSQEKFERFRKQFGGQTKPPSRIPAPTNAWGLLRYLLASGLSSTLTSIRGN